MKNYTVYVSDEAGANGQLVALACDNESQIETALDRTLTAMGSDAGRFEIRLAVEGYPKVVIGPKP